MDGIIELYIKTAGQKPVAVEKIPGAGSNRTYVRLYDAEGKSVIGVTGTSLEENNTFIYLSDHFSKAGLPVPKVLSVSDDRMCYIQTDLGKVSLFDALSEGRRKGGLYSDEEKELLKRAVYILPEVQIKGAENLDFSRCYPTAEMNETNIFFDLNYFKYCFLKTTGIEFNEIKLEEDFRALAADLLDGLSDTFMYRDFQARNIMLDHNGNPYLIDFQGGRKGPLEYDVASFLWQASALYTDSLREELIDLYVDSLKRFIDVDEALFRKRLIKFVLFRILQVLGAYGYRGYFERKSHFLESINPAIQNLRVMLDNGACPYSYLNAVLVQMTSLDKFAPRPELKASESSYDGKGPLRVRVFSFSYKKGIPEDESGNGGGYVFDCRSTHNPGRYEPYKKLTGLDEPVIEFLEQNGEILTFLDSVYKLADAHVARYIKRGFTDLMFSFGCTGGQHRSVYSAQHLAEYINNKFGIEVVVCHREQGISQVLKAK